MKKQLYKIFAFIFLLLIGTGNLYAQESKPLILQEMSWLDVENYLKENDMVIIPLGSTEQHGKHLPLGTDYYEAMGSVSRISARTGVLVAPVLLSGYSEYHSGFPGTLSLKPETMEQVLFETAELLISYGLNKIMFFNYHGGNNIVQDKVIHRINHTTGAVAIAIGIGGTVQKSIDTENSFDWHAGKGETSIMLYLHPELVQMEKAEKPQIQFPPEMKKIWDLLKEYPELTALTFGHMGVPVETGKKGASHEISSNGVWSDNHPNEGTKELGEETVTRMVNAAVRFIEAWKKVN